MVDFGCTTVVVSSRRDLDYFFCESCLLFRLTEYSRESFTAYENDTHFSLSFVLGGVTTVAPRVQSRPQS